MTLEKVYRIGFSCAALLSPLAACQRDNDVQDKPSAQGETIDADIVSSESASELIRREGVCHA